MRFSNMENIYEEDNGDTPEIMDVPLTKSEKEKHQLTIRRKLEEKLEEKRLRQEAEDDFFSY